MMGEAICRACYRIIVLISFCLTWIWHLWILTGSEFIVIYGSKATSQTDILMISLLNLGGKMDGLTKIRS